MLKTYVFVVGLGTTKDEEEIEIEIPDDATKEEEKDMVEQEYKEWLHGGVIDKYWHEVKPLTKIFAKVVRMWLVVVYLENVMYVAN